LADANSDYYAAVLADSPYLYWGLDDTSGTSAADLSGNARPGTYAGSPTLALPPAADFGGHSAFFPNGADVHRTGGPATSGAISMEAWIAIISNPGAYSTLIGQGSSGANGSFFCSQAGGVAANTLALHLPGQAAFSLGLADPPSWHHYVLIRDGAAGAAHNFILYVDGLQISNLVNQNQTAGSTDVWVNSQGSTNYGNAYYDEVAFYATALTQGRALAHVQAAGAIAGLSNGPAQANQLAAAVDILQQILASVRKVY
jgi:Concanavalin A-like lectin/glucanases superfamily